MGRRSTLTKRQRDNIVKFYQGGAKISELGRKYRKSPSVITNILKKAGVYEVSSRTKTKEIRGLIVEGYREGKSIEELMVLFSKRRDLILLYLREAGISAVEERYEGLLEKYEEGGKSYQDICDLAEMYGVTVQTIYTHLRKKGVVLDLKRGRRNGERNLSKWDGDGEGSRLVEMYEGGATLREIGEEFGISGERVRQVLIRRGVSSRNNRLGNILEENLEEMLSLGMSNESISDLIGVSYNSVVKKKRSLGLTKAYVPRVSWDWRGAEEDYLNNVLSLTQIAEKYGLSSYNLLVQVMDNLGHPRRGKGIVGVAPEDVLSDYVSGLTRDQIAHKWGISKATVDNRLKEARYDSSVFYAHNLILEKIKVGFGGGGFSKGDVRELCSEWGSYTIRDAIERLIRKGLVERVSRNRFKVTEG